MSATPSVAIIDYQMSNLYSVAHACEHVGLQPKITNSPGEIEAADAVILPGVGAFGDAMQSLRSLGMDRAIHSFVKKGKPLFGICLGLQLLMSSSSEFGTHTGLSIIPGLVARFPITAQNGKVYKVPHIGWNTISVPENDLDKWDSSPLKGLPNHEYMYFVHSFYVQPHNPNDVLTTTTYGNTNFCSSVLHENVFATQFHPEKSGKSGLQIYNNFKKQVQKML